MRNDDYEKTQSAVIKAGISLVNLDLDGFLHRIDLAESVGPFVEPTLFIRGADNLAAIKELAEAARNFQSAFDKMRVAAIRTLAFSATKEFPRETPPPETL